jgi:hypothetical protein
MKRVSMPVRPDSSPSGGEEHLGMVGMVQDEDRGLGDSRQAVGPLDGEERPGGREQGLERRAAAGGEVRQIGGEDLGRVAERRREAGGGPAAGGVRSGTEAARGAGPSAVVVEATRASSQGPVIRPWREDDGAVT